MDSVLKNISFVDCCTISMNKQSQYFLSYTSGKRCHLIIPIFQDIFSLYYRYDLEKKSIKSLL